MSKPLVPVKNGVLTGLIIQLAVGPIFFFVINLTLQKTVFDGLMGALAMTIVSYLYIALAAFGIGKLFEHERIKKIFGILSSIVLIIFGGIIIVGAIGSAISSSVVHTTNLFSSFASVFLLAISNPLSIVFFTGLFSAKALEYNYTKKELYLFGFGVGLSTLIFTGGAVLVFSLLKGTIPSIVIQILNILVGTLIIGYGAIRLGKLQKENILARRIRQ